MASIQEKKLESVDLELEVCPDAPTIKPKRRCFVYDEEENFSLGDIDSLESSQGSDDSVEYA